MKHHKLTLAKKAIICNLSGVLAFLLACLLMLMSFFNFAVGLAMLSVAWTIGGPLVGIVLGIVALTEKERTKGDTALAIIAIALPILVVLTVILLFSTGVFVIRFM